MKDIKVNLEKTIEEKHWKVNASVEFNNQKGWTIIQLNSVNGKPPRGQVLADRFSSIEIEEALKLAK